MSDCGNVTVESEFAADTGCNKEKSLSVLAEEGRAVLCSCIYLVCAVYNELLNVCSCERVLRNYVYVLTNRYLFKVGRSVECTGRDNACIYGYFSSRVLG